MKVGDLVGCKMVSTDIGVVLKEQGGRCLNVQVLYAGNRKHWTPVKMLEVLSEGR
jgi:hypothetical protein